MKRAALIALPYLWLMALFFVPFLIVAKISLSDYAIAIPPYTPTLDLAAGWQGIRDWWAGLDIENYQFLTSDELYWRAYLSSLKIAFASTVMTLLVGYPIAYAMSRARDEWRPTLLMLVILPFWTSFLIRVYAWKAILSQEGLLNQLLINLHIISEPLTILNTNIAVYIGIVYTYLPFMVLPLYAALEKLDDSLLEAAEDLGWSRMSAFWLVTLPLSKQGVIAGSFLVFIPAMGEYVIPELLGG
ncbi:MAG: ABC transporter permease subunit, partial [Maritimibacter sp.]